jgi:integrase
MTDATLRQALNHLGWGGKFSPHATRTTGSTRLNEMGFSPDWIERQLAHAEPNAVRRAYNQADYLANRTTMMQQWADMLDAWTTGAKVLPLRSTFVAQ